MDHGHRARMGIRGVRRRRLQTSPPAPDVVGICSAYEALTPAELADFIR